MKSLLIKVYLVINKDINNIYLYKEFDYNLQIIISCIKVIMIIFSCLVYNNYLKIC